MDPSTLAIIIALIALVPGGLSYYAQIKRNKIDINTVITEAAAGLIVPLKQEIKDLRAEVKGLKKDNEKLRREIRRSRLWSKRLAAQVEKTGGVSISCPTLKEINGEEWETDDEIKTEENTETQV
jgi:hypothetical protein